MYMNTTITTEYQFCTIAHINRLLSKNMVVLLQGVFYGKFFA